MALSIYRAGVSRRHPFPDTVTLFLMTKQRYRSAEERRRIVEETLAPGTSVAIVARAHEVNANQMFGWRKLYPAGLLRSSGAASVNRASPSSVRLLPVTVSVGRECGPEQIALVVGQ